MEYFLASLELKANINDVNEALDSKSSKTSVSNALHRKANKTDIEEMYATKQEIEALTLQLENIDGKAENSSIEKLAQILSNKVDKSDFSSLASQLNERINDNDNLQS